MVGLGDIFGTSSYDKNAAAARQAANQAAKKGAQKQLGAINTGYDFGRQALAPALTSVGDYLGGLTPLEKIRESAYGSGDPSLAANAFAQSVKPGFDLGQQSILRLGPQGVGSGRTLTDLQDYAFNQYNDWRTGLNQFDPYNAIALQGTLGGNLANLNVGQGTAAATIFGNKFNTIGAANAGYQNQLAANRSSAAGNLAGLINAGISGLTNVAGNYIGGGGSFGFGGGSQPQLPSALASAGIQSGQFPWMVG